MEDYSGANVPGRAVPETSIEPSQEPIVQQSGRPRFPRKLIVFAIVGLLLIITIGLFVWLRLRTPSPTQSPASPTLTESPGAERYTVYMVYDPEAQKIISYGAGKFTLSAGVHTHDLGTPIKPESDPGLFIYKVRILREEGVVLKDFWYQAIRSSVQSASNTIVLNISFDFLPGATVSIYDENEVLIWSGKME